jgi:hypothetical protein
MQSAAKVIHRALNATSGARGREIAFMISGLFLEAPVYQLYQRDASIRVEAFGSALG